MRTVLVSHIDLDGYGCNIFAMKYIHPDDYFNVNYEDLATTLCDIPRDVHLIITDLSIPENLQGLIEEFAKVSIIDHHISTMWVYDAFDGNPNIDVKVDKRRCATWLLYDWIVERNIDKGALYDSNLDNAWADKWRTLIDDYDRYVLSYPESERLNSLLYISNRDRFVSDALSNEPDRMLALNAERIDRYLKTQNDYIEATVKICLSLNITDGCQHDVYLAFAEKYKSKIAKWLFDNKGAELVYVLDLRTMQGSIRSSPESRIDCASIAKMIDPDGGGHHHASGFTIPVPPEECGLNPSAIWPPMKLPINDLPMFEDDEE